MKTIFAFLFLAWAVTGTMEAQVGPGRVAVEYKDLTVAFHSDPKKADPKGLPLIGGILTSGSRETFGVHLGGVPADEKILEILGPDATVLKSISISEFLNIGGSALWHSPVNISSRRAENVYSIDLPTGRVKVIMRALATGDGHSARADQHLVITFALKSEAAMTLALRVSLPAVATVEGENNGYLVAPKSGGAAIAAAVYPAAARVSFGKNMVVLTSGPVSLDGSVETPALWMVMDGVASGSTSGARSEAIRILREARFGKDDPHVVVVSMTDRQSTQPGDTVAYTLICANIGTGEARDVALSNPIPAGMEYLVGSATTNGHTLSFERSALTGQRPGAVEKITWKFSDPVKPGGEQLVNFKVRVR